MPRSAASSAKALREYHTFLFCFFLNDFLSLPHLVLVSFLPSSALYPFWHSLLAHVFSPLEPFNPTPSKYPHATHQHTDTPLHSAKRYERLMKANNIEKKADVLPRDASVASAKVRRGEVKPGGAAAANKKRKTLEAENPGASNVNGDDDDDEEPALPAMKKKKVVKTVKKEAGAVKAESIKKEEGTGAEVEAAAIPQFDGVADFADVKAEAVVPGAVKMEPDAVFIKKEAVCEANVDHGPVVLDVDDDASMFDQFLQPGDFDRSIVIAD